MTSDGWGPRDWRSNGLGGSVAESRSAAADPSIAPVPSLPEFDPHESDPHESDEYEPGRSKSAPPGSHSRKRGRRAKPEQAAESSDPAARARDICLRLLTGSSRTRRQLADSLRRKEIPDEIAEQVLDRLTEVGLIDDAAYARAWVEQRQRHRGLARRALAGELRAKGVDGELVAQALAEVDPDDEEAAARGLVERKLSSTRGLDRQVRIRRLAGMLARRGYPEGLALRVVRSAIDAEGALDADDEDVEGYEED